MGYSKDVPRHCTSDNYANDASSDASTSGHNTHANNHTNTYISNTCVRSARRCSQASIVWALATVGQWDETLCAAFACGVGESGTVTPGRVQSAGA